MTTFEEYAQLARELHQARRAGEQDADRAARRREATAAAIEQLDERLADQAQRLAQLAQLIGRAAPPPYSGSAAQPPHAGLPVQPPYAGSPVQPPHGGQPALPGTPLALPATHPSPVSAPAAPSRLPAVPQPRTGEADAVHELELARRAADAADEAGAAADAMARRPPLLPGLSPLSRAVAVYLGCAFVAVLVQLVLVLSTGQDVDSTVTLFAWMCAGLPALAFFAGYIVLSAWGKPVVVAGTPPRYARLGFALCFLAMPIGYCGWWFLLQFLSV